MKWLGLVVTLALIAGSGWFFMKTDTRIGGLKKQVEMLSESGDPNSELMGVETELQMLEGQKTINGGVLAISGAVFLGILFVTFVLPAWADRAAEEVFGSGEQLDEEDELEERARESETSETDPGKGV